MQKSYFRIKNRRVFLIGMPGAGKTTLAQVLGREFKLKVLDLDSYILTQNPIYNSVETIFESEGAAAFRKMERRALEAAAQKQDYLIATGGGTPCFFDNMDFMLEQGLTIFLNANLKSIYQRLKNNTERPLFKGYEGEKLFKALQDMHIQRLPFYRKAHITFNNVYLNYLYENYCSPQSQ